MYKMKLMFISLCVILSVGASVNASKSSPLNLLNNNSPALNKNEATSRTLSAIAGPYGGQIVSLITVVLSIILSIIYIVGASKDNRRESGHSYFDEKNPVLDFVLNEASRTILGAIERWETRN